MHMTRERQEEKSSDEENRASAQKDELRESRVRVCEKDCSCLFTFSRATDSYTKTTEKGITIENWQTLRIAS
jgi:hypothetical protein